MRGHTDWLDVDRAHLLTVTLTPSAEPELLVDVCRQQFAHHLGRGGGLEQVESAVLNERKAGLQTVTHQCTAGGVTRRTVNQLIGR